LPNTLLLDRTTWDLVVDANGNIAVATEPYSLAQDAASAIKTFLGECYWDVTVGIDYFNLVFEGPPPSLSTLRQLFVNAALTVPGVASAKCFFTQVSGRALTGQIQVTSSSTGQVAVMPFTVINLNGYGPPPPQAPQRLTGL
jgi:hypothetical protein